MKGLCLCGTDDEDDQRSEVRAERENGCLRYPWPVLQRVHAFQQGLADECGLGTFSVEGHIAWLHLETLPSSKLRPAN